MTLLHGAHRSRTDNLLSALQCPICEQPIPTEKVDQAGFRLQAREREVSERVGARLQEQYSREREQIQTTARAELERVQQESATALAAAAQEMLDREIVAREQGALVARNEVQHLLALAESETAAAIGLYETLQAEQEAVLAKHVEEIRESMERANTDALNAVRVQHFEEKQKLTGRLEELARQMDKKSAEERGEGAEVNLFETLREEFPRDDISRVAKGAAGPDIIHDIVHNGKSCGRIIYDCKDRASWRNEYAVKLRGDQTTAGAAHSILSTRVFPAGARQLCEYEGVLVANPARVVALVYMLRRHLVQMDALRLSHEQRERKTVELYGFMCSDKCAQMFERIDRGTEDLLHFQEKERKEHETRWQRQEVLYRSIRQTTGDLRAEIDRIIAAPA